MSEETIIDLLLEEEELLKAMLSMPDHVSSMMVARRREELFDFLWEYTSLDKIETLNLINRREVEFVNRYDHLDIPEWLLRMEAQDTMLQMIHEKADEENLI